MPSGNTSKLALIVQQGKVLDFIDGTTQREETPEEYVRQEIAKSIIREYGYSKKDVAVEFVLRVGVRKPRADLVLFITDAEHRQENALMIVECKAQTVKSNDRKEGIGQLQSYMSVCPNSMFGMWTNGVERYCYRKVVRNGLIAFEEVPDLPSFGEDLDDVERPAKASIFRCVALRVPALPQLHSGKSGTAEARGVLGTSEVDLLQDSR